MSNVEKRVDSLIESMSESETTRGRSDTEDKGKKTLNVRVVYKISRKNFRSR